MARKVKGSEVTDSSKKIRPALTPEAMGTSNDFSGC